MQESLEGLREIELQKVNNGGGKRAQELGNLLHLDLGIHLLSSSLFFLSSPPIVFVALVGFEGEGFEHLVCSCHCISCIGLSSPR